MKTILSITFLFSIAFTSCLKTHTCVCTPTPGSQRVEFETEITGVTKKIAKESCDVADDTDIECELK
ncbi:MAG: hypothetical protein MRY83_10600 [Flavobacteriales bacterium]|nr:hypothetical protein [Flavobacteriales bacterium]